MVNMNASAAGRERLARLLLAGLGFDLYREIKLNDYGNLVPVGWFAYQPLAWQRRRGSGLPWMCHPG